MSTFFRLTCPAFRVIFALALFLSVASAAGNRVLYVTTSAGYRHDSLPVSVQALRDVGTRTGLFDLVHTEDTAHIDAETLRMFDAVLFFTSGELPLSESQKQALLDWIDRGGSFGAFHSATDTLYGWPAYGELVGAYFDGHPWTQEATVLGGSSGHPVTAGIPERWRLMEEYYQFRDFAAGLVHVLLSLDTESVDLRAPGVKAATFPLAWIRPYGKGRVFYTALGHFDSTWTNPVFTTLLNHAMRYLLNPITVDGIGNAASMSPMWTVAPGSLISIYGRGLTESRVTANGQAADVLYTSATQVNARLPANLSTGPVRIELQPPSGEPFRQTLSFRFATPGIFAVTGQNEAITLWTTGLGGAGASDITARIGQLPATVLYAGPAPGFPGLDQVNLAVPSDTPRGRVRITLSVASAPDLVATTEAEVRRP